MIRAKNGERSIRPPMGGTIRRIGAKAGSVIQINNRTSGAVGSGLNQDSNDRITMSNR